MLYSVYNEFVNLSIAFFYNFKKIYSAKLFISFYMPKIKPKSHMSMLCKYINSSKNLTNPLHLTIKSSYLLF